MGAPSPRPVALDSGALIALESPRGRALLRELERQERTIVISAGALAQAWRDPARQVLLSRLVAHARSEICPLDAPAARACGRLLAKRGMVDVVDAHVALTALEKEATVIVTSDPEDLERLDPSSTLMRI